MQPPCQGRTPGIPWIRTTPGAVPHVRIRPIAPPCPALLPWTVHVRRATETQARAVRALERVHFPGSTRVPGGVVWWVVDGDPSNGYAGARMDGDALVLERAWVAPALRGRGLQGRLVRARVAWGRRQGARRAITYTWGGNVGSMRALVRAGFLPARRSWDGTHSWITFERPLT